MGEFNLLQKTELRIERISLRGADLNDVSSVVAEVLGMARDEVLVTDALDDVLTIDILRKSVDAYALIGKRDRLFQRLAQLPGVGITEKTSSCSEGMLGWIVLDEGDAKEALKRCEKMMEKIRKKIAKRAIVFSTGFEVSSGQIKDTNKRTIAQTKDHTIEGVLALDPKAATPYICKFEKGTGRHVKDGVRVGVGKASETLIVALPGPNDEVKSSLEVLVKGLQANMDKHDLAEQIASRLRESLRVKMMHGAHSKSSML
jgi:hypothetical protein